MIIQNIKLTVDNLLFTIINSKLQILLIKRLLDPYKDCWAIPWWFVLDDESIEKAAYRELYEETNVEWIYLEQLFTFWDLWRDPRWRVVSVAYMSVVSREKIILKAWTDAKEVKFFPIVKLPKLAFDHKEILNYWIQRLKYKMEYTNISKYFLSDKFTLSELQNIYEIVFEKKFDARNFRKKIDKLDIIAPTWEMQFWVKHRPAMLYKFLDKSLKIVEII